MNIILVDDHAQPRHDARKALEQILEAPTIHEFDNASSAADHYRANGADMLVTDIVMPGMSGIDLAATVLAQQTLPVILHTGSWARDTLYRLITSGALDQLPLEIVNKQYYFPSFEAYAAAFSAKLERAQEKARRHDQLDITPLTALQEKLHKKDTLIDYLKSMHDELGTAFHAAVRSVDATALSAERRAALLGEQIDFSQPSTELFLHNLRYPLQAWRALLRPYYDQPEYSAVTDLLERMERIRDIASHEKAGYVPEYQELKAYEQELERRPRKPLPEQSVPVKARNRQITLAGTGIPLILLQPGEKPDPAAVEKVFKPTGAVIVRSMHPSEDDALALAGFFFSGVVPGIVPEGKDRKDMLDDTIHLVRTGTSIGPTDIDDFCRYRGFSPPRMERMVVGIEPYRNTEYRGAVLEHPSQEGVVLVEFEGQPGWVPHRQEILYDCTQEKVLLNMGEFRGDANQLCSVLTARLEENKQKLSAAGIDAHGYAYQMEFGFTDAEQAYDFQMRTFKRKQPAQSFAITNPIKARSVFGVTDPEGVEMVVLNGENERAKLCWFAEQAGKQGLSVAFVFNPYQINKIGPICIPNLGLVITQKDLAVQKHNYFNALAHAQHALMLSPPIARELNLEHGQHVKYVSNGREASITKIDTDDAVKYRIREAMNHS